MFVVLGAAIVLNRLRDRLCGSVKFIFQSGEETLVGAKRAIEAGLMDGETDIKYMFAVHVKTDVPLGKIGAKRLIGIDVFARLQSGDDFLSACAVIVADGDHVDLFFS